MGKIFRIGLFALIAFMLASVVGCSTGECLENQNSLPLAGFYSMDTKRAISVNEISVYGVGAPNDSMIIDNGNDVSEVYLPLRSSVTECKFVFHYNQEELNFDEYNDTLTISYSSSAFFDSEECGAMYRYDVNDFSYTRNVVDSVSFLTMRFDNKDKEGIRIFFKTAE